MKSFSKCLNLLGSGAPFCGNVSHISVVKFDCLQEGSEEPAKMVWAYLNKELRGCHGETCFNLR